LSGESTAALKVIREQPLELIVLDLNFPIDASTAANSMQDGFGVLGWMRHRPETCHTPVIVISSDPPEKSKARALASGAAVYLPKPVDKHELAAAIASLLPRRAAELGVPTIA
jgi:CheY-like chemotaxis protein